MRRPARFFWDRAARVRIIDLVRRHQLSAAGSQNLRAARFVIATSSQLTTALALIELDGVARRLTILPPDAEAPIISATLIASAEADAVVIDRRYAGLRCIRSADPRRLHARISLAAERAPRGDCCDRMGAAHVRHDGRAENGRAQPRQASPRRSAGKRPTAPSSGARSMTSAAMAACRYFCARCSAAPRSSCRAPANRSPIISLRLARHGVTHLSGTPSHWRRALMSPANPRNRAALCSALGRNRRPSDPRQPARCLSQASVGHAYASTEAGVAFEVNDGLAGFPASYVEQVRDGVEMKVVDGSLRIRSPRTASRYVGTQHAALTR